MRKKYDFIFDILILPNWESSGALITLGDHIKTKFYV